MSCDLHSIISSKVSDEKTHREYPVVATYAGQMQGCVAVVVSCVRRGAIMEKEKLRKAEQRGRFGDNHRLSLSWDLLMVAMLQIH